MFKHLKFLQKLCKRKGFRPSAGPFTYQHLSQHGRRLPGSSTGA